MKRFVVDSLKKVLYGRKGEPYDYYGHITRFKIGTRPARMKYIHSDAWDVRNDILQLQYLKENFSENGVLWDIGACNGEYGILAATLLKDKKNKIFCFEPDRSALGDLRDNLALNDLENAITVFPVAISDRTGRADFLDLKGNANSHFILDGQQRQDTVTVDCITMEDLLKKLPVPTLVKIDVEGAELKILNGDNVLMNRSEVTFLVELHPWAYPEYKAEYELLVRKIAACNRKIKVLDEKKTVADLPCYGSIIF